MNKCLNCNENCEERFCGELCKHGYMTKAWHEMDREWSKNKRRLFND